MITLAIDTATQTLSLALVSDEVVLVEFSEPAAQSQAERLPQLVAELLLKTKVERNQISCVALGVGPGAYTGLRVGLMFGLTFAKAVSAQAVGFCTHDAIAPDNYTGLVVTDARRKEVYVSQYKSGKRISGPLVVKPESVSQTENVLGDGVARYPDVFVNGTQIVISAGLLGQRVNRALLAGEKISQQLPKLTPASSDGSGAVGAASGVLLQPLPIYLRRPDVAEPK